jgi:TonB family protein
MDCMDQDLGLVESVVEVREGPVAAPALLVELPPWHKVFLHNLGDSLWPRRQPPLRLASKPSDFWPDVFVKSRLPWGRFLESGLYHTAAILTVWAGSLVWPQRVQTSQAVFHHDDVIYYQASDYLPPLDTGGAQAPAPKKGQMAYAPQPIISVPPEADNRTQTIVTPPDIKLNHDVPLPNVVAWAKTPQAMPIAATERTVADTKAPDLNVPVVAPPPDVQMASSTRVLSAPQPAVVEPAPVVDATSTRRLGELNMGHSEVVAPAPQLPVQEQRTLATADAALGSSGSAVVPPPPSVQGSAVSASGGRLIALGIHPVAPTGPVQAPAGNRRGSFAASPQGKPGAAGTPDLAGKGQATGAGGSNGHGGNGAGSGSRTDVPPGLFVGAGPNPENHSAIGGNGQGSETGGNGSPSKNSVLMASVTPPRVMRAPRRAANEVSGDRETEEEKKVFGDRKFYAMTLNVPNLNSAGGSWVIHFAELGADSSKGDLTAPVATREADPAYPLELMKRNVQGTVTLYAVIRSDGSVGDVRVLNGPDDRLGQYAREALERWQFRPATKNGVPVSLEAVVRIPFRPGKARSLF